MDDFELLLVKDCESKWLIQGITYSNALLANPTLLTLKASYLTIQYVKQLLHEGKTIYVSKNTDFPEILISDLVITETDGLQLEKNIAINNICGLMHSNIIGICVIDAMDFLQTYIQLINAGIFITDENREDKYLEIIEKSQLIDEPEPLAKDASFEDEQKYISAKQEFDNAQNNLVVLEKYLNAYDKLFRIKYVNDLLNNAKNKIENAQSIDEINNAIQEYKQQIDHFK